MSQDRAKRTIGSVGADEPGSLASYCAEDDPDQEIFDQHLTDLLAPGIISIDASNSESSQVN